MDALVIVPDLMFQPRIVAAIEAAGLDARIVHTPDDVSDIIATAPAIAVIDVHAAGFDVLVMIVAAKAAGARVLAFGRHTEPQTLRAAREAGADSVVPRSQLVEDLHELLASLIEPESRPAAASGGQ